MKHVLRTSLLLALFAFGAAGAAAEPVQQFDVQLKDITAGGRFSLVVTSNSFDTSGGPPPALTETSVRLPKGISIKPAFLKSDRLCEAGKLRGILLANETASSSYKQMLENLPATQKRIQSKLTSGGRKVVDSCRKAYFGSGSVVVDARPQYADALPGLLYLFLSKPTAKGAVAGVGVMLLYDTSSPIARKDPLVTSLTPAFTVNIFNEPTADGLYGYRVKFLPENARGFRLSAAELRVEAKGIATTSQRRTCAARRQSRCVRYTVKKTTDFWATAPRCPASGTLRFQADYRYTTGQRITSSAQVPCPRFKR